LKPQYNNNKKNPKKRRGRAKGASLCRATAESPGFYLEQGAASRYLRRRALT
jgi:hypothetical protein